MRTYRPLWILMTVLVVVLVASAGVAGAARPAAMDLYFQTLVLSPEADTLIYDSEWEPDRNYAGDWRVWLRSDGISAMLLAFDVSELGYDKNDVYVASATLSLYALDRSNPSQMVASAVAVRRPWVATEATWTQATATTQWQIAGCVGPADLTGTASQPVTLLAKEAWVRFDVSEIVRGWVDDSFAQNGIAIKSAPVGAVAYQLATMDLDHPELRPKLEIIYAKVPTPPPALEVEKIGPAAPRFTGSTESIAYSITVTNPGETAVSGVNVVDVVPLGSEYVSSNLGGVYDPETSEVSWEGAGLGPGEAWTVQVTCRLSPWVRNPGTLVNVARATCPECPGVYADTWVVSVVKAPLKRYYLPLTYRQ